MVTPVRGMSTRAVQAERTRQQILETAQRLFTELGYDATSLQMIADELGLTKAAVYYHFRAKSDILHAAMQPGIQRLEALLDEAAAIRGRRARIEHLVDGFVDFLVEHRHYAAMASTDPGRQAGQAGRRDSNAGPARPHPALRRQPHRRRAARLRRPVLHPGVPARPGRPDRRGTARSPADDDTAHVAAPARVQGVAATMSMSTHVPVDLPSSHWAIQNLIVTYAELVDDGDFAGLGTLLAEATFMGSGALVGGPDAIEKMFRDTVIVYDDGTPRTRHVTTNIAIDVDEEAGMAVSRSYFTVLQALPDLALQPIASGRYHDRFEHRDGQWRFAERARPSRSRRRR